MFNLKEKFSLQSIRSKIVIAFLSGCLVIFIAWGISRVIFHKTFSTIDALTQPNQKLTLVNNLFQKVNQLDPLQKLQEFNSDKNTYKDFLPQSDAIIRALDSLKILCLHNAAQVQQIDTMKAMLYNREKLFVTYLKYRNEVIYNKALSKQIKELSRYIADNINNTDSSVVTRKEKTTTTVVSENNLPGKEKQSFFKRLFKRKKKNVPVAGGSKTTKTEDLKITIDTISVAQRDSFIRNIEAAITSINTEGRNKVSKLLNQEFELYRTGNLFINELQKILHDIQNEEYVTIQNNTVLLGSEFDKASADIGAVLLLFLFCMAVLVYLIFSDITKSNVYKEQLVIAKEKAEQSEQVKQRFLANMSHEIRTPLQSIIGFSEQLHTKEGPDKKSAEIIHRSSEHLLQIVNEVLDYSRIVSGKFTIEQQEFNMQELIAEVADTMDLQAERKRIQFIFKADASIAQAYSGDAFRLKQILYNLLGNAIKFTTAGSVHFSVSINEATDNNSEFIFDIKDSGIGIEPEQLENIFNAFEQSGHTTQRLYGGTGLGLGIVKSLVELQGGTINVESELGKGSCFTVRLPYKKVTKEILEVGEHVLPALTVFHGKIMVVDDDPFILQLCSLILDKQHLKYVSYSTPKQALDAGWDKEITLVLLDIRMPGMSGVELRRLLKQKAGAQVKFVALTAQALPEEKEAILKQGFSDILLKPFHESSILELLHNTGTTEPAHDIVDLSELEALCMHDAELIKKTLDSFMKNTSDDLKTLKKAVSKQDVHDVGNMCHRLASKVGQVGARALSFQLKTIEKESHTKETAEFFKTFDFLALYSEIDVLVENIKSRDL